MVLKQPPRYMRSEKSVENKKSRLRSRQLLSRLYRIKGKMPYYAVFPFKIAGDPKGTRTPVPGVRGPFVAHSPLVFNRLHVIEGHKNALKTTWETTWTFFLYVKNHIRFDQRHSSVKSYGT